MNIVAQPCPACGALSGDPCRFKEGAKHNGWTHIARDSNSDPQGGDALAAPGEASQSGGAAASPNPLINQETPHAR